MPPDGEADVLHIQYHTMAKKKKGKFAPKYSPDVRLGVCIHCSFSKA